MRGRAVVMLQPKSTPHALWLAGALLFSLSARADAGAAFEDDTPRNGPDPGAATPALDSSWWLRLRGGYARGGQERQRSFGLLELCIGLDGALAAPASEPDLEDPPRLTPAAEDSDGSSERASVQTPARAYTMAALTPAAPEPRLTARLARATVAAAVRILESVTSPRQLDAMASRARAAASLPEVRLGAGTSSDESLKFSPTVADPARFSHDGGRDLWFEARLTWQLDRALFARDELAVERLKAQARDDRARVTREVLDALLDWQRARQSLRSELLPDEERDAASLRELGAVARLDVLTDGWFSHYLEQNGAVPTALDERETPLAAPSTVLVMANSEACSQTGRALQRPSWLPKFGRCSSTSKGASMR